MPPPLRNERGEPVNEAGERVCGSPTRWCVCGLRPVRGEQPDHRHHHQHDHARSPEKKNVRRGACTREGCACTGFDPYPCHVTVALYPNGRCRKHGGPSLEGMANPSWRGRGASRVLPERLLAHYHEALDDPNLLSLRQEIALQRALLNGLLERLRDGDHVPRVAFTATSAVQRAWRAFTAAYRSGHAERMAQALTAVDEAMRGLVAAMEPARAEADLRRETRDTTNALERLARSENTRLTELHNMVTAERALALQHASVQALIDVLEAHVPDAQVRVAIRREAAQRLQQLVRGGGAGGELPPAGGGS